MALSNIQPQCEMALRNHIDNFDRPEFNVETTRF